MRVNVLLTLALLSLAVHTVKASNDNGLLIGAYYYDGWSGSNSSTELWAEGLPRMVTKKLKFDYPDREPVWGWRDDDVKIMERQIDLAAKNGIDFFAFCWYWSDDNSTFNEEKVKSNPRHKSLELFLKAKNKGKMKFCIMIANHNGAMIQGEENWKRAISYFSECYFKDSQYLLFDNNPVVLYYMPHQAQASLKSMNEEAKKAGYGGLYTMSCGYNLPGYNAQTWYNSFEGSKQSEAHDYSQLTSWVESRWESVSDTVQINPLCSVGWDRRPWESNENTVYYINKKPSLFRTHLMRAVDFVLYRENDHPVIMIYAWNELGEGGYLVPTKGDPRGKYLKQVKKAKKYARKKERAQRN